MEFVPITDHAELNQKNIPFTRTHAMAIVRREESICLSTPLKRLSIGFGPMLEKTESPDIIFHKFPWAPSGDDGSKLIRTYSRQRYGIDAQLVDELIFMRRREWNQT